MKAQVVLALALVLLGGAVEQASATLYWMGFSVEYVVDYEDREAGDFWTTTDHKLARGIRVRVLNPNNQEIFDGYANLGGTTAFMWLNSEVTYTVELWSDAIVANNNRVVVYNNDTQYLPYKRIFSFTPTHAGLAPVHFGNTYGQPYWEANVAAAIGYAVHWHPGGLSNQTFVVFTEGSPMAAHRVPTALGSTSMRTTARAST
jgi:hypothetical protein